MQQRSINQPSIRTVKTNYHHVYFSDLQYSNNVEPLDDVQIIKLYTTLCKSHTMPTLFPQPWMQQF